MSYAMHFQYLADDAKRPSDMKVSDVLLRFTEAPIVPRIGELIDLVESYPDKGIHKTYQVLMVRHQVFRESNDDSKLYRQEILVLVGDPKVADARLLDMKE
ncbi:MAG TPA: hypothetical protein VNV36_05300 [Pseudomonas sp.]|uniref:hypothetical protein n=1 Tax=Pseudomonas sp. TaxID=306 RepID=UPI002C88E9F1|nr:hypothetical protein [Pseudomonas sp.]HWH86178.1 hypothetical protein [Pseudomonas sp.]